MKVCQISFLGQILLDQSCSHVLTYLGVILTGFTCE